MNYILMPSLEHIALVKTAVTLWNQNDIRYLMAQFSLFELGDERIKEWEKLVERRVIEKVSKLPLPEYLKNKLLHCITPIGLQIVRWLEFHFKDFCFCTKIPNEFVWTPQGRIDLKKTAEILIKDENLDIARRYKLACIYCFENHVLEILKRMPDGTKSSLYVKDSQRQYDLIFLSACNSNIKREVTTMGITFTEFSSREASFPLQQMCSSYRYAFECAAEKGNKAAIEYLLKSLTPEDKDGMLVKAAGIIAKKRCAGYSHLTDFSKVFYTDILCLLFSLMDNVQQVEVIKSFPFEVLRCFLDWPWHIYFLETANRAWNFLSKQDYRWLLQIIPYYGNKNSDYRKIFGEFWEQSPYAYQSYIINEVALGTVIECLFLIKDTDNIKLIFQKTTAARKKKLILNFIGYGICQRLYFNDEWGLLEFFVQECLSSEEEMTEFKVGLKERIARHYPREELEIDTEKLDKLFLLCDLWMHLKKGVENAENNLAKTLSYTVETPKTQ